MPTDYETLRHLGSNAIALATMAYLARIAIRSAPDRDGWHRIVPSAMQRVALMGSASMALFVLYVRVFVGSARADAESQMMAANWLIAAFAIGAAFCFWHLRQTKKPNVFWRRSTLCFTTSGGRERLLPMTDVVHLLRNRFGWLCLSFRDGTKLWLPCSAQGVDELFDRIIEAHLEWRSE